jgi:hypothetical protein
MTDFEQMVAFLEQEATHWELLDSNIKRYTMKVRFGRAKDFYVDFNKEECSLMHNEVNLKDLSMKESFRVAFSDFKTHVDIQEELDRIL